ncbi:sensor histidine kinase [Gracilibacillus halophilus YIM-C55.5]|uniref:histidine kinase n=1 Tax=Gracilibacillus halophilus YIM-C55.5 TaxID=1308866 RepID=N4W8Y6_9BACI|nr:ATP-binding protein [Gracilibacillus halophilus]ENH95694.1 sensor histidine kinase [Gracilibacillus halophilus YIM-C55.5]
MKLNSVVFKLGATILFLQLIILIPLGFIILQLILNYSYTQTESQLLNLSEKYATEVESLDGEDHSRLLDHLTDMTDTSAAILNADGDITTKTHWDDAISNQFLSEAEQDRLQNGETISKEQTYNGTTYLKVAQPIMQSDGSHASVVLFSSFGLISSSIHNIIILVLLASLGAVVLAIGFTIFISKKLGAPLIEMEKAAKQIAEKQDFSVRVNYQANDEIGSLANAVNHLSRTLERYKNNRNEFFSNITHELKTPLTYVKGYANAVRHEMYQSKEERDEFLDIIENETDHISYLMDDMMDLSKIEEGKIDLNKETFDVNHLLDEMVRRTQFKADEKGLALRFEQPAQPTMLYADKSRIEQIVINLVENAVRYTESGSITLQARATKEGTEILVTDTGIGIRKEDIPYLFERFYRVDKSRSRANGGTGLGLSIVKYLVDMHDGTIDVDSEINIGTKIRLFFPVLDKDKEK